jgi:adenosine deaminase
MKSIIRKILKEHMDEQAGQIIKDFMNETFDTYITSYYNWWDEIEIYVHIKYKVTKVSVWKSEKSDNYEGTVYVQVINTKITIDGENFEDISSYDDIPEVTWDYFTDDISDKVRKYFSADVDVDVDFTYVD